MRVRLPLTLSVTAAIAIYIYPSAAEPQTTRSNSSPLYGQGWKSLAPIASGARQEHSVTAIGNIVYIIGGIELSPSPSSSPEGVVLSNKVEAYDTILDSWSTLAPLPLPLNHANAASVDGKIYVLGGLNASDPADPTLWAAVGNSYVYDPAQNHWTELAPMPAGTERGSAAVGVQGSKIYLAGGLKRLVIVPDGPQDSVDTVSVFDTQTRTWAQLPHLPARRDHVGGAIVDETFYVLGGRDRGVANVRNTVFALNLRAHAHSRPPHPHPPRWATRATMPTARGGVATGVVNDKIYIFGGEGNPANGSRGVFDQNEVYDPRQDTWEERAPMPVPRHGTGAVAIRDVIYVPGGGEALGGAPVVVNEGYFPPRGGWGWGWGWGK